MSAVRTRGILLRAHPYSESSRVLRFLTEDLGVVGVMAKGIRRAGKGAGLDLFGEVELNLYVKPGRGLQTLREVTTTRPRRGLGAHPVRLACAGILAELVLRHHEEMESPEIFHALGQGLDELATVEGSLIPVELLRQGWHLVSELGFHPQVDRCVQCGRTLDGEEMGRFDFEAGGMRCSGCAQGLAGPRVGPGARGQLRALLQGRIPAALQRPRAHLQLLSDFITYHVSGSRPLEAFRFLAAVLPVEEPAQRQGEEAEDAHA